MKSIWFIICSGELSSSPIDCRPFISLSVCLLIILKLINKPLRCTECNRKTRVTFTPDWSSHEWIYRSCLGYYNWSYRFQKSLHYFFDQRNKVRVKTVWKYIDINVSDLSRKHIVIAMIISSLVWFYSTECTIFFLNWFF